MSPASDESCVNDSTVQYLNAQLSNIKWRSRRMRAVEREPCYSARMCFGEAWDIVVLGIFEG